MTLTLVAIIIPVSLLTTFKITGIIKEPLKITHTIELDTVTLTFDRPSDYVTAPAITNGYVDENILVNASVPWVRSLEQGAENNRDMVEIRLWLNTTAFQGFLNSVEFSCYADNVSWVTNGYYYYLKLYNATVSSHNATVNSVHYTFTVSNPAAVYIPLVWTYLDNDGSVDHQLSFDIQAIYYNGTAYCEVVIPLRIEITRDVGNTFEEAKMMTFGDIIGSIGPADSVDIYSINLEDNQTVFIGLTPPKDANFDVYLYNQHGEEVARSTNKLDQMEEIVYTVTTEGIYYIKIEHVDWPEHHGNGIYQLETERV
jgi:hypothetical protein